MPSLVKYIPERIGTYWEPFIGGGAVFFTIANRIDRAILSDTNRELILTYLQVKTNVEALIGKLKEHAKNHKRNGYYLKMRQQSPENSLEIAARFIYLNKTCYNGLYRVNKSGKFNVPQGSYKNPTICDEERLRNASKALEKATIMVGSFDKMVSPNSDDFIYCDPPYDDCWVGYQADGFTVQDQENLRNVADVWIKDGAKVMLSNSKTPLIDRLFKSDNYRIHDVEAPRSINSNGTGRGAVTEVIITSYD